MRPTLAIIISVTTLALAACEQTAPPTDTVAADEAATETPRTAPPTSPAQASAADKAAAK